MFSPRSECGSLTRDNVKNISVNAMVLFSLRAAFFLVVILFLFKEEKHITVSQLNLGTVYCFLSGIGFGGIYNFTSSIINRKGISAKNLDGLLRIGQLCFFGTLPFCLLLTLFSNSIVEHMSLVEFTTMFGCMLVFNSCELYRYFLLVRERQLIYILGSSIGYALNIVCLPFLLELNSGFNILFLQLSLPLVCISALDCILERELFVIGLFRQYRAVTPRFRDFKNAIMLSMFQRILFSVDSILLSLILSIDVFSVFSSVRRFFGFVVGAFSFLTDFLISRWGEFNIVLTKERNSIFVVFLFGMLVLCTAVVYLPVTEIGINVGSIAFKAGFSAELFLSFSVWFAAMIANQWVISGMKSKGKFNELNIITILQIFGVLCSCAIVYQGISVNLFPVFSAFSILIILGLACVHRGATE